MNNDNFMVFVYNAIITLFAFFVAAPMLLNAISLFTVQKRFAKVMEMCIRDRPSTSPLYSFSMAPSQA